MQCPCGSGKTYPACCAVWHEGGVVPTAEALMRSRYSAYVLNKVAYLHRSWSAQTRPIKQALKKSSPLQWLGLEIIRTERGTALDNEGVVEFVARYQQGVEEARLHETSQFRRENGRWVYVEGNY